MARARNIKHGFFTNDKLAECSPLARILFAGLWTIADREGRLEDRPKRIKAELLPYDDCSGDELLGQLANAGFIQRYTVGGNAYIQIDNFLKHQNPHVKEAVSTIPAPDGTASQPVVSEQVECAVDAETIQAPEKHGASTVLSRLIPDSLPLIPDSGFLIPDSGFQGVPPAVADEPPAQPELPKPDRSKVLTVADLVNHYSVDPQVATDFMQVRRDKRAKLTITAMAAIERESLSAGLTVCEALRVCAENGWQGFKADWYANLRRPKAGSQFTNTGESREAYEQRKRDLAEGAAKILGFSTMKPVSGEVFDA